MKSIEVTIELAEYMREVSWDISEMVKVLRGVATNLDALNESMRSINSSLAEIRKFLILGA